MVLVSAAILGIIQGLTEFLPISSSAHLIVVPWLIGWTPQGLAFDVALHVGTALSVLVFFRNDWFLMARETIRGLIEGHPLGNPQRKLAWFLVVATIPAAVAGLAFGDAIEGYLRSPMVTVITLTVFGVFLLLAERKSEKNRTMTAFTWADSIWIGLSQAVALIPGVSRSGITMTTALARNSDRITAARFSFLLSTPVIVGAGMLEGWRFANMVLHPAVDESVTGWPVLIVGFLFSAATGFLCIRYFLKYLQSRSFTPFVVYRFLLAAVILVYYLR